MTDHNGVVVRCDNCIHLDICKRESVGEYCRSNFEATTKALEDRIRELEKALDDKTQEYEKLRELLYGDGLSSQDIVILDDISKESPMIPQEIFDKIYNDIKSILKLE